MSIREEPEAFRKLRRWWRTSPDVRDAIEALRAEARRDLARRTYLRRKRLILALEIAAGALLAAGVMLCAAKLTLLLAR